MVHRYRVKNRQRSSMSKYHQPHYSCESGAACCIFFAFRIKWRSGRDMEFTWLWVRSDHVSAPDGEAKSIMVK
jgi:hypothetical protein